jgi:type III restriction enzyme
MQLKKYQDDALTTLRLFFEEARVVGAKGAYEKITTEPERVDSLGRFGGTYKELEGLPNVPYVCLRLPTGGGKTILACHSITIAKDAWVDKDYPLVLWLVPTKTIRTQTADALKNTRHPYRQALDNAFDGRVRVFDIGDFTQILPHDIRGNLCIVVGTIQALRVSNTEGRKVYSHNENLETHFSDVSPGALNFERENEGTQKGDIKFSFANLMHLHRPLMIVDEAHQAVTGLTRDMQQRVNPCAIIEYTATPQTNSNILFNVLAQELKKEEMIKLPIMLAEHPTWQDAVNGAVNSRAALEETAKKDKEYIRPIILFQAQKRNEEVTVEVLKKHLIEVEQIPKERIAIATGEQRELDGFNLFDAECPIEYVITMQALKEGWDCSFAYVFCSVANIQSATDVEQLLGRVLRMPFAKRREEPDLNKAYAHVSATSFQQAAQTLCDKLIDMGFEDDEAHEHIQPQLPIDSGLFGNRERSKLKFTYTVSTSPEVLSCLNNKEQEGVSVTKTSDGKVEITVVGEVAVDLEKSIEDEIPEVEREGFKKAVNAYRAATKRALSPAARGDVITVPRLVSKIQGEFEFADADVFMEFHDWSLLDHSAKLDAKDFDVKTTVNSFEIDLNGNRVTYQFASEAEQLILDIDVEGWTDDNLALWLDRQVRQSDIKQSELLRWVRDVVAYLTGTRKLHISALMRCKFILARKLRETISEYRQSERDGIYQQNLFAMGADVGISFDDGFIFGDGMYWDQRKHRGRLTFGKHFLGPDNVPSFDGTDGGEEEQCAAALDSLAEVKYWIRNVARHLSSFWLPTATDKFYPDFVAELNDGRLFVVEYKGAHLADSADTIEKRLIGKLWEDTCADKGLFMIVEKEVDGKDMREQMRGKVEQT